MKQSLFSIGDDFAVKDENGNDQYYFDGKVGTLLPTVVVLGSRKQPIAKITKKLFAFSPSFTITDENTGEEMAVVRKKILSLRPSFLVDVPGPNDITVIGKMFDHDYKFYRNKEQIAQISKSWFTGKDTYGIEVEKPVDALLVLASAVIIDLVLHPKRDSSF